MGDRGNIKVYQDDGDVPIYLYTHWRGDEIYQVVKTVLSRRQRWKDTPYLTRILFCELVKDDVSGETGFGISTSLCDNEHTIIGVNPEKQEVTFEEENGEVKGRMTFEQFVTRKDKYSVKE